MLLLGIIPFALLAYYNYNIYKGIKLPPSLDRQLSLDQPNQSGNCRSNQETDLARVLIGIVITFIFCHSLRIILNFMDMISAQEECWNVPGKHGIPSWAEIAVPFNKLLLIVNSSTNMIIYCCLNAAFRRQISSFYKHFYKQLCCCCNGTHDAQNLVNIEMQ